MTSADYLNISLTVLHIAAGIGILNVANARGCRGMEAMFWGLAAAGTFTRPFSLYFPTHGKGLELVGVGLFVFVLYWLSGDVKRTKHTVSEVRALVSKVKALTQELAAANSLIRSLQTFIKGIPMAAATFTAPADDGGGMNLIYGTRLWNPFHKHVGVSIEESIGRSHYDMNPEVADNDEFRAAHVKVSREGVTVASADSFYSGAALAWVVYPGEDGGISIAAARTETGETADPTPQTDAEIRAWHRYAAAALAQIEAHHADRG